MVPVRFPPQPQTMASRLHIAREVQHFTASAQHDNAPRPLHQPLEVGAHVLRTHAACGEHDVANETVRPLTPNIARDASRADWDHNPRRPHESWSPLTYLGDLVRSARPSQAGRVRGPPHNHRAILFPVPLPGHPRVVATEQWVQIFQRPARAARTTAPKPQKGLNASKG